MPNAEFFRLELPGAVEVGLTISNRDPDVRYVYPSLPTHMGHVLTEEDAIALHEQVMKLLPAFLREREGQQTIYAVPVQQRAEVLKTWLEEQGFNPEQESRMRRKRQSEKSIFYEKALILKRE